MKRRDFLSGLIAGAALAGPALAQDFVGSVIAQLRQQGFLSVAQERTLLGRVRITASRKDGSREIIINPNNGEIMRDLWTPLDRGGRQLDIINDKSGRGGGGNGGGGSGGSGDDDEDDEGDEGDDKSGSGGGSGSGNSGGDDDEDDSEDEDND